MSTLGLGIIGWTSTLRPGTKAVGVNFEVRFIHISSMGRRIRKRNNNSKVRKKGSHSTLRLGIKSISTPKLEKDRRSTLRPKKDRPSTLRLKKGRY